MVSMYKASQLVPLCWCHRDTQETRHNFQLHSLIAFYTHITRSGVTYATDPSLKQCPRQSIGLLRRGSQHKPTFCSLRSRDRRPLYLTLIRSKIRGNQGRIQQETRKVLFRFLLVSSSTITFCFKRLSESFKGHKVNKSFHKFYKRK